MAFSSQSASSRPSLSRTYTHSTQDWCSLRRRNHQTRPGHRYYHHQTCKRQSSQVFAPLTCCSNSFGAFGARWALMRARVRVGSPKGKAPRCVDPIEQISLIKLPLSPSSRLTVLAIINRIHHEFCTYRLGCTHYYYTPCIPQLCLRSSRDSRATRGSRS
jgi:hypothetical protein